MQNPRLIAAAILAASGMNLPKMGSSGRGERGVRANTIREKIPRNGPCPCGSGIKYKKCCRRKIREIQTTQDVQGGATPQDQEGADGDLGITDQG